MFIEALGAAINEHFSVFMGIMSPEMSFRSLLHISILDQCGLLQKHEEYEHETNYSMEIPIHQEEIIRHKKENEEQWINLSNASVFCEQHLKKVAIIMRSSAGWFEED
uniref:Uncharacterized protein n=1 Tax=Heterorhabditis bacteriophora TaxID=37862 RepID=A0A1I7WLD9_HETBA